MAKRGLISSGAGGSGVNSYIDLENRPDDVIDTTVVPAGTTGGDFTPNNDNGNKVLVSISDNGRTITTTKTNNTWGSSGTFSTESMNGDGYVSFKLVQTDKRYMVGLSRASDAGSTTYATIDYAIYINAGDIRVYENSSPKGVFSNIFTNGATYKIQRTGSTITYLINDVVFYTSATATTVPLYMDTAFLSRSGRFEEATMLNAPVTPVARTATYKIDYNNVNLINKPDIHVNVLVSDTNFATIALALANDAVKTAHAGDFVKISGDFYHVIKTNPTVADDLLKGSGEDLPPIITDNQVTTGVGTEPVLVTPTKLKTFTEAHSTGHIPVIVSATDFSTVALALANDAVKTATAGDFVKISGDVYVVIKTSPTVSADLVDINGDPDLSALATKAELSSGLSEKVNLDTYLLGESLPGVPVTDGIEMAYFPKLPLTELTDDGKVSATSDPKNGRRLVQADVAKQPTFLLNKKNRYYYDVGLEQSLVSEGNISAGSLGGTTGKTTSFMFVFTPNIYINNTQFMWGTESSPKRLSVHLMRDSAGRMVIDHGSNIGGRYSLTTSTLVAGKVNSLLFVRNDNVAEVWINGVSQGSQTIGNNLPTDATALPFSIGVMVGNNNYKSALGFNALFFYGRALTVHERTLMIAYSKKEYESIDPVELPSEITDAQVTSGTGTDEVLPTPAKLKVMIETHSNGITPSFETISSNLMAWDVVARTYTDDPSDASKKVLASVGISDSSDATKVVVITYTWNSNGTIQNEVLSFSNRVFPATVKKTKTYSYTDGRISRIVYT